MRSESWRHVVEENPREGRQQEQRGVKAEVQSEAGALGVTAGLGSYFKKEAKPLRVSGKKVYGSS